MKLAPVTLENGERYGDVRVLYQCKSRNRGPKYRVGCVCGWRFTVSASKLMRGEVKACLRCTALGSHR